MVLHHELNNADLEVIVFSPEDYFIKVLGIAIERFEKGIDAIDYSKI